jgi:hypothetical protein
MTDTNKAFKIKHGLEATTATIDNLTLNANGSIKSVIDGGVQFDIGTDGSTDHTWILNPSGTTSFPHYTFPADDGSDGQSLVTDGSGNLSWSSPGGSSIQYAIIESSTSPSWTPPDTTSYGAWTSLTFAETTDPSGWASVSGDTFTLAAGTYDIRAVMKGINIRNTTDATSPSRIRFRLRNTTASTTVDNFVLDSNWDRVFNTGTGRSIPFPPMVLGGIVVLGSSSTFQFGNWGENTSWLAYGARDTDGAQVFKITIIKLA